MALTPVVVLALAVTRFPASVGAYTKSAIGAYTKSAFSITIPSHLSSTLLVERVMCAVVL